MVYFVGAGPGATDLITVKGQNLLMQADVVIYAGSLVNKEHLNVTKKECEIYNSAQMTLEEVTSVLIEGEKQKKQMVRLHTGDPSIYGAIREQMDILSENDVPFEVIPGVSSFCAVAAALKAEYTLPNVSQTVILTRMEGQTPVPEKEDISALARHQASMVIFLSSGMIEKLVEKLIEGGYTENTSAAIVYKASWEDEKTIRTTLGNLKEAAEKAGINKTALIVVGEFLGNDYERSLLYHPQFTHGFREGEKSH